MRSSLFLVAALIAPAPLLADGTTWYGCGATFNTCASAEISAQQLPSGRWELSITVTNLAHEASIDAYRNSLLTQVRVEGAGKADYLGATDATGQDVSEYFRGEARSDGRFTVKGYTDRRDAGQVVWRQQAGTYSTECAANASCDALRPVETATNQSRYFSGPITFRLEVDEWNEDVAIAVFQGRIGGEGGGEEAYELTPRNTTVTPEPGTMALLATGLAGLAARGRRRKAMKA